MTPQTKQPYSGKAITILVLGILSLVTQEWIGLILGIAGIVLYVKAKNDISQQEVSGKGMAIAGLILSIVGVLMQFFDVID
ncbi:hypothetical protein GCM10028778_16260 [Barrientosiimonas marina]|uniref:DUF4190 domain-containing protein n=1 Tax=Lentibacillus kimchii TaxID=1542911 RepID=A0ABW2UTC4_9BACI